MCHASEESQARVRVSRVVENYHLCPNCQWWEDRGLRREELVEQTISDVVYCHTDTHNQLEVVARS